MISINPVQSPGAEGGAQPAEPKVRVQRPQPPPAPFAAHAWEPDPGTAQRQQIQGAQKVAAQDELAQDVVEVQRDSQITNQVVIKYMVQATGQVILQVPSSELLAVDRGISQDLQREVKPETSVPPGTGQGGKRGY